MDEQQLFVVDGEEVYAVVGADGEDERHVLERLAFDAEDGVVWSARGTHVDVCEGDRVVDRRGVQLHEVGVLHQQQVVRPARFVPACDDPEAAGPSESRPVLDLRSDHLLYLVVLLADSQLASLAQDDVADVVVVHEVCGGYLVVDENEIFPRIEQSAEAVADQSGVLCDEHELVAVHRDVLGVDAENGVW